MKNYHDLVSRVIEHGTLKQNRTGVPTLMLPAATLQFDLREGFPAITTKKLAFNAMKGELLGFFRGYTSAADFRALGCKVWDDNANKTPAWLANPNRIENGVDYLGNIYGVQWTAWRDTRYARTVEQAQSLSHCGYTLMAHDEQRGVWVFERHINQVENVLRTLLTNPTDRRMFITGWRPDEFDNMALPPCHVSYNFMAVPETNELHLVMTQRSADLGLGIPFNVASSSLFLALMARLSGFEAATMTLNMADAHVYLNHVEPLKEQLKREPFAAPTLVLGPQIKKVNRLEEIAGAFAAIEPSFIELQGYQCHPTIPMEMAA